VPASPAPTCSPTTLRREHDVAVASAFALLDADHHAAAVDVGNLDPCRLGGAQSGRVGRGQSDAGLQARHRLHKGHDLVGAQHRNRSAQTVWFSAGQETPPATRCT
jgi:hypothetical protein